MATPFGLFAALVDGYHTVTGQRSIAKAHIKEHTRHNPGGSVSVVKEYEDNRAKKAPGGLVNLDKTLERFQKFLKHHGIGWDRVHHAQTGTIYLYMEDGKKVRFADHGDAYGDSAYTVDGHEGTLKGAQKWVLENYQGDVDAAIEAKDAQKADTKNKRMLAIFTKTLEEGIRAGMSPVEAESRAREAAQGVDRSTP